MNKCHKQIVVGLIFTFMFAYAVTSGVLTLRTMLNTSIKGWQATQQGPHFVVTYVNPAGTATDLREGDEILGITGEGAPAPSAALVTWPVPHGFQYRMVVRRENATREFSFGTANYPSRFRTVRWLGYAIIPAFFLLTALVLFALKPHDSRVSLLVLLFCTFVYDCAVPGPALPRMLAVVMAIAGLASSALAPLFLHFLLRFPEDSGLLKKIPRLTTLLYLPYGLFILAPAVVMEYRWLTRPDGYASFYTYHPRIVVASTAMQLAYMAAGLLVMGLTYRASNLGSRRKIRVVFAGFLAGGLPLAIWNSLWSLMGMDTLPVAVVHWIEIGVYSLVLLMPVSLAYAVLRYRVIPISLLLRRSARYLLVSRGFVFLQTLFAFAFLGWWLNSRLFAVIAPLGSTARVVAEVAVLMLAIGALKLVHRLVRPVIDRHFFRDGYDARDVLSKLGTDLSSMTHTIPLLDLVAGRIQAVLHVESVHVFRLDAKGTEYLNESGSNHDSLGEVGNLRKTAAAVGLPVDGYFVPVLTSAKGPVTVDFPDEGSWVHARLAGKTAGAEGEFREYETLRKIQSTLLVPINIKGQLYAVISLGPRLGDLPYGRDDQQLLSSIAWLTAFAIENLNLFEREAENLEQLRQAQKMEAVGRLAGGIAHDFNNLLTVITGYSDLMLRKMDRNDVLRGKVEEVKKAGDRAAGLTRQLLAFSRKQILQPKIVDLNDIVVDTFKMLQRLIGEDIELLMVPQSKIGKVKADPGQLEQILLNLAVNARDAMPIGGKLTIKTSNVHLDHGYTMQHVAVQPGDYVLLSVSDTGCGMDAETRERIFEPFFTTKEIGKGTGLGLSTVYGIVKQSGGHVWVYSEVGHGTTFKIYLPREVAADEVMDAIAERDGNVNGTETVLLVEDEGAVRNMTRQILEELGYQVIEAENGPEAIRLNAAHNSEIDLLLTDVVMPRMSGRELADHLTAERPDLRVLYTSGYTEDAIIHHGVLDDGMAFLEKPFTPELVALKVREVLDARF
jgi:signal transduction histidine kinase/ActR/RegA family two-component response regulator